MYQFADGFDNYGVGYNIPAGYPWDTINGINTTTTDVRFAPPAGIPGGSNKIQTGNSSWIRKNLTGTQTSLIMGFGFKLSNLPAGGNGDICALWDTGTVQVSLGVDSNGAMQFYRSAFSGTAIGAITPNATIQANVWYGAIISVTISATVGTAALYLNGNTSPILNGSGLNTQNTANAFATQVSLGGVANGRFTNVWYDDFYCLDTTGGFLNTVPSGDQRIITKLPSGAGNYTNWTPNGLGSNWQNASQAPPNIADFNSNNVGGTKDSYALPLAGLVGTPTFVVVRASLERDDAAVHTPSLLVRSSSTDGVSSATPALSSTYQYYDAVFQNDPNTSAPWTAAGADAAQIGVVEG